MTYEQAKEILKDYIQPSGDLYSLSVYLKFEVGSPRIVLDGEFDLDEIMALAIYMSYNRVKYITLEC